MSASTDVAAWLDQYVVDQVAAASNPLRATIGDLTQQLADRDTTIADLRARIEAMQKPPTPAPAPSVTVFGQSVDGDAIDTARARGYRAFRVFYPSGWPSSWDADPRLASANPGEHFIISEHTATPAQTAAFAATIPDAMKPTVWLTHHHEPENDGVEPAAYRAEQKEHHDAAKSAGVKLALILMGWTADPGSGRDYRDYYVAGACDAIFWDAYNPGNKKSPPIFTPVDKLVGDLVTIAKATGIPWGVTETGAKVQCVASNGYANRAAWAAAYAAALKENGALYGVWWDRANEAGTFDVRLDDATATAWR